MSSRYHIAIGKGPEPDPPPKPKFIKPKFEGPGRDVVIKAHGEAMCPKCGAPLALTLIRNRSVQVTHRRVKAHSGGPENVVLSCTNCDYEE